MKLSNILSYLKQSLKFWIPAGLLDVYRSKRPSDTSDQTLEVVDNIQFLLPEHTLNELFPGIESSEVSIAVSQIYRQHVWASPINERLCLAAICKRVQPQRIFEIGTYTGSSTLVMAMNTPSETEIFTLDLEPSVRDTLKTEANWPVFTVGSSYQGTPVEKKIHQLFGSSLTFDYSPFYETVDIIFIDAVHSYDFVKVDTENAFKLLKPGGIIIWDDYLWDKRSPECAGVTRYLNELRYKHCFQVLGTRFAIYRDVVEDSDVINTFAISSVFHQNS